MSASFNNSNLNIVSWEMCTITAFAIGLFAFFPAQGIRVFCLNVFIIKDLQP